VTFVLGMLVGWLSAGVAALVVGLLMGKPAGRRRRGRDWHVT
jgi:hypothetical protein